MDNEELARALEICRLAATENADQVGLWERWGAREAAAHVEFMKGAHDAGLED